MQSLEPSVIHLFNQSGRQSVSQPVKLSVSGKEWIERDQVVVQARQDFSYSVTIRK